MSRHLILSNATIKAIKNNDYYGVDW